MKYKAKKSRYGDALKFQRVGIYTDPNLTEFADRAFTVDFMKTFTERAIDCLKGFSGQVPAEVDIASVDFSFLNATLYDAMHSAVLGFRHQPNFAFNIEKLFLHWRQSLHVLNNDTELMLTLMYLHDSVAQDLDKNFRLSAHLAFSQSFVKRLQ